MTTPEMLVWELGTDYPARLIEANPGHEDVVEKTTKAEEVAKEYGHAVCYWLRSGSETEKDYVGSFDAVENTQAMMVAIQTVVGRPFWVVCSDALWEKIGGDLSPLGHVVH